MRIHDKLTVEGKLDGIVVRGTTTQMVIDKAFAWLNDAQLK